MAFAQEQAMVVSSTPVVQLGSDQQSRIAHYNVVYEYAGNAICFASSLPARL